MPRPTEVEDLIELTADWWERWAGEISYEGPYEEIVVRSAITMKLLTYSDTGALVAAPTMSLPEVVGSGTSRRRSRSRGSSPRP